MPTGEHLPEPDSAPVWAAGGLVWRNAPESAAAPDGPVDRRLVCLVHRPLRDDWSLPKGKLEPGEHPLTAAVREVREEAGVTATPRFPLPVVRYRTTRGQEKRVEFWAMPAVSARAEPLDSEVDQVVWLPVTEAARLASYPDDRRLLRWWATLPAVTSAILLIRHVDAGDRRAWQGDDALRPVSPAGMVAADTLGRLLALFAPTRLVSATALRCRQTLFPLAHVMGLPVVVEGVFDELDVTPDAAAARVCELVADGGVTVVCSHRAVIPPLLARLRPHEAGRSGSFATTKGDGWYLPFSGPLLLATTPLAVADRLP